MKSSTERKKHLLYDMGCLKLAYEEYPSPLRVVYRVGEPERKPVQLFLSPDNYVQGPGFTQSFNRYSYCINNPLKYFDPTGNKTWFGKFFDWVGESIVAKVVITAVINTVGIGALIVSGGRVGGFGYYNGKSDWMINFGYRKPNSTKFYGINIGGDKEGFYMYGQTVIPFNSPTAVPQTTTNYGGNGITEHDLQKLGSNENKENYNSVEYTGFYYDNAEEMRNQLHHMSDMQGGVELILAEDYAGGAYLLPSKVYNGKEWLNNGLDNAYVSSYHLTILNLDKADIKMFGHDHDWSYRFTNPDDYNLFYNWRKSIYIIMPDGRILYKHYPTGVEYNYIPGY